MPDACVQPLLHPARQHGIPQHDLCGPLHIVHVHPAAFTFERRKLGQQQTGKPCHALLVVPGFVLGDGRGHAQRQVLRLAHGGDADDFFAKLARRAFFSQQRQQHGGHIPLRQGLFKLNAFG